MHQHSTTSHLPVFMESPIRGTVSLQSPGAYATAWSEWCHAQDVEWSWFATLTYQRHRPVSFERADRDFRRWIRWVEREALPARLARQRGLPWLRVIERHADATPHVHAVLGDCLRLDPRELEARWGHGIAQVDSYEEEREEFEYFLKQLADGCHIAVSRAFGL